VIVAEIDFSQDIVAIVEMKNIPEYLVYFFIQVLSDIVFYFYMTRGDVMQTILFIILTVVLYNINIENVSLSNS